MGSTVKGGLRAAGAVLVMAAVLGACSGASEPATNGPTTGTGGGDVLAGEVLYQNNCASCHGVDLNGTDKGPPHLDIVYEPNHHADIAFQLAVERGVQPHHWDFGPMPPIEGLSPDEVEDIVAYVRAKQREVGIG